MSRDKGGEWREQVGEASSALDTSLLPDLSLLIQIREHGIYLDPATTESHASLLSDRHSRLCVNRSPRRQPEPPLTPLGAGRVQRKQAIPSIHHGLVNANGAARPRDGDELESRFDFGSGDGDIGNASPAGPSDPRR